MARTDWIKWDGGICPVKALWPRIDVRFGDGTEIYNVSAEGWRWSAVGAADDIFAYRVIAPASAAALSGSPQVEAGKRWQHVKRKSTYVELGRAELQKSGASPLLEGDTIVVYRCEDTGKLWARPDWEFDDGRILAHPPLPADVWNTRILGQAIYRAMYESSGGRWEANESKAVWYKTAERMLEIARDLAAPTPPASTEGGE